MYLHLPYVRRGLVSGMQRFRQSLNASKTSFQGLLSEDLEVFETRQCSFAEEEVIQHFKEHLEIHAAVPVWTALAHRLVRERYHIDR